MGSRSK
jgi:hypothetical protein